MEQKMRKVFQVSFFSWDADHLLFLSDNVIGTFRI